MCFLLCVLVFILVDPQLQVEKNEDTRGILSLITFKHWRQYQLKCDLVLFSLQLWIFFLAILNVESPLSPLRSASK